MKEKKKVKMALHKDAKQDKGLVGKMIKKAMPKMAKKGC